MAEKGKTNNPKGRPPGIKDIRHERDDAKKIAERLGCDPFEVLCFFMKGDADSLGYKEAVIPPEMRLQAAKEACKYIYPTLKAIEHKGDSTGGLLAKILKEASGTK
jgi:hypothetical protein